MRSHVRAALFVVLIVGGFYVVGAQQTNAPKRPTAPVGYDRPAAPVNYDPYTYTGKWYGYVTDTTDFRQGYKASAEQIKKSIAAGAEYLLYNPHGGRLGLAPPEKVAPFAGQRVIVTASITSRQYGSGPTAAAEITNNGGFASPEPRSITTLQVISITATELKDAYDPIVEKGPGGAR